MSGESQLKIKDLNPSTRGEYTLVFEVAEVVSRHKESDSIACRVVDETGVINAYFDQYSEFVKEGGVYELKNFRCKVFEHHLRLEMIKKSVLAKIPKILGFKDLENNLSEKFYVHANANVEADKLSPVVKEEEKIPPQPKIQETKNTKSQKPQESTVNGRKGSENQSSHVAKEQPKVEKKYIEKKQVEKQDNHEGEGNAKKGRRQANQKDQVRKHPKESFEKQQNVNQQRKKAKYVEKNPTIKLAEMPKYQQELASFCVRVNRKTLIQKGKYSLCKVSDSTGSTYFQFLPSMKHLQDRAWYKFNAFKVFGDYQYGFIATQQENSSFELLEDHEDTPDSKLLWKQ